MSVAPTFVAAEVATANVVGAAVVAAALAATGADATDVDATDERPADAGVVGVTVADDPPLLLAHDAARRARTGTSAHHDLADARPRAE